MVQSLFYCIPFLKNQTNIYMKKWLALSLLIFPAATYAQFVKGNYFLGGTLSASVQRSDPAGSITASYSDLLSVSPMMGFFLNERIAVGAAIGYTKIDSKAHNYNNNATTNSKSNSVGISPFIRFYHPISSSFYFALQGSVGFTRGNTKTIADYPPVETVDNAASYSLAANLRPILIFFPSKKWSVEASVGALSYSYNRTLPDAGSMSTLGVTAGGFTFGGAYYFLKKK
jgi:hypothetical protein